MSNKVKAALVPKLRFPEFRGADGWKGIPLSELVSALDAGVSVNSGDRPATGNEIGILKTSAVTNGIFEPQENKVVFDEVERGRVKEPVQAGTIIISRMNTPALVGANAYVETSLENIYLPDRLWSAKSKTGTSMRFVASILGSDKGRAALSKLAKGSSGSMKNITKPDVLALLIQAPSPAEQQKIADCLSSLDDLIAAQARNVDALKTQKKGLMRRLFPIGGETQPRLRFPEFRGAGDWDTRFLGELCDVVRGGSPRPIDVFLTTAADGLNWLKIGDVDKDAKYVTQTAEKVRTEALSKTRVVNPGDLILSNSMSFGRPYILQIKTCIHDGWIAVTNIVKEVERDFLYYLISAPNSQSYFVNNAAGSGVKNLNADIIKALSVCFPSSSEQQRISDCLASLDNLIAAATQELETLKTHKNGLMQQLFPSAEVSEI